MHQTKYHRGWHTLLSLSRPLPTPSASPHKVAVLLENGGSERMEGRRPHPIGVRSRHPHGYRALSHVLRSLEVGYGRACEVFGV